MSGPEAGDGPNPFSFKNFVKRANTNEPSSAAPTRGKKSSRASSAVSKAGEGERTGKKKKKPGGGEGEDVPFPDLEGKADAEVSSHGDNPFSFTKFIQKKDSKRTVTSSSHGAVSDSSNSSSDNSEGVNDVIVRPPKVPSNKSSPSATKRHVRSSTTTSSSLLSSAPLPLRSGSRSASVIAPSSSKSSASGVTRPTSTDKSKTCKLFPDSDSSTGDEDSLFSTGKQKPAAIDTTVGPHGDQKGGAVLEDLFDEPPTRTAGLLLQNNGDSSSDESISSPEVALPVGFGLDVSKEPVVSGTALEQLKMLRAENSKLKEDLEQSRQEATQLRDKNTSLKQRVKALKKKEAEETKALEEMVLKVESNLETTTKRAISAETTIVKLKQEITSLQTKLAHTTPESVQQHYEEMLGGVREKANYSSQQLVLAAHTADQYIKELAGGVETLKHVAEILQFVDNICEIKEKTST